jgi:hypothetical protein
MKKIISVVLTIALSPFILIWILGNIGASYMFDVLDMFNKKESDE